MNELKGKPTNQNHSLHPLDFQKSILVEVDTNIQYKHQHCDSETVYAVSIGF